MGIRKSVVIWMAMMAVTIAGWTLMMVPSVLGALVLLFALATFGVVLRMVM